MQRAETPGTPAQERSHPLARFTRLLSASVLAALLCGCGDEAPTSDLPPAPAADAPPPPPTTQDILNGPRKTLSLDLLPFTLEVPEGWKIVRHGERATTSVSMLQGLLPSGHEAHIILGLRESITPRRLDVLLERAAKDHAAVQPNGGRVTLRDIGEARVVERRQLLRARSPELPTTAPAPIGTAPLGTAPVDAPTTGPTESSVDWRIQLFVPSGINYSQYELNIMDLHAGDSAEDEAFLSGIFSTLKYAETTLPPL